MELIPDQLQIRHLAEKWANRIRRYWILTALVILTSSGLSTFWWFGQPVVFQSSWVWPGDMSLEKFAAQITRDTNRAADDDAVNELVETLAIASADASTITHIWIYTLANLDHYPPRNLPANLVKKISHDGPVAVLELQVTDTTTNLQVATALSRYYQHSDAYQQAILLRQQQIDSLDLLLAHPQSSADSLILRASEIRTSMLQDQVMQLQLTLPAQLLVGSHPVPAFSLTGAISAGALVGILLIIILLFFVDLYNVLVVHEKPS